MKCHAAPRPVSNSGQNLGRMGVIFELPSSNEAASRKWRKGMMDLGVPVVATPVKPAERSASRRVGGTAEDFSALKRIRNERANRRITGENG
jgi:hypothetical protein